MQRLVLETFFCPSQPVLPCSACMHIYVTFSKNERVKEKDSNVNVTICFHLRQPVFTKMYYHLPTAAYPNVQNAYPAGKRETREER